MKIGALLRKVIIIINSGGLARRGSYYVMPADRGANRNTGGRGMQTKDATTAKRLYSYLSYVPVTQAVKAISRSFRLTL